MNGARVWRIWRWRLWSSAVIVAVEVVGFKEKSGKIE